MNKNNGNNGMTKIEGAAVKRFTQYNKLCKTCPTLLQPKIATLEELIMGLSKTDRQELLDNVAERMEMTEQQQQHQDTQQTETQMTACSSSEDLFKFQTGTDAIITTSTDTKSKKPLLSNSNKKEEEKKMTPSSNSNSNSNSKNQITIKTSPKSTIVNNKFDKVRLKYESNKHKLTQVTYLVNITTLLLSSRGRKSDNYDSDDDEDIDDIDGDGINNTITAMMMSKSTTSATATTNDPTVYHAIDELQIMTRSELKMARLKYMACCSKYQQKIAKSRLKIYKLTLEQEQETYDSSKEQEQQKQNQKQNC
jgi:hypothetical protein